MTHQASIKQIAAKYKRLGAMEFLQRKGPVESGIVIATVGLLTAETARRDVSMGRAVTVDTRRRLALDEVSRQYAGFGRRPTSYRRTPSGNDDFLA